MHLGRHSFLLQDYYVEDWAANCMMHMLVDDVERWWAHIASLDLPSRYDVKPPRAAAPVRRQATARAKAGELGSGCRLCLRSLRRAVALRRKACTGGRVTA